MQILKGAVKQNIIDAAMEEFLVNGYINSSLRTIASEAGITIGNIYNYFSSKDELFEIVVAPAQQELDRLMAVRLTGDTRNFMDIAGKIVHAFVKNKQRFFILMNCARGSRFENFKMRITEYVGNRVCNEFYIKDSRAEVDPLLAQALVSALIEGLSYLFNHYGGDDKRLSVLVNGLLLVFMRSFEHKEALQRESGL